MVSLPNHRDGSPSVLASYRCSSDQAARELAGDVPVDMRFPIGSVTKTLTALLTARLCVDGLVSWTEPLEPASGSDPVSLHQLLTHTASIPFELHAGHWNGPSLTDEELSGAMGLTPRLSLPPGTWHYSNLGYAMVATALERTTGRDFAELLAEHVLQPLGMTATSFPDALTEGRPVLGAAAPAGDIFSTLGDLMLLARALEGHRPDVVTWPMMALLLKQAVPVDRGGCLGAGIRVHRVRHHRVLVSTGTLRDRTTCLVAWPSRGSSVLVAEAGYSHDALREAGAQHWRRDGASCRTWWWDGQEVVEVRHGEAVDLLLRETTWPYALFSGQARDRRLVGVDWRGEPLELLDRDGALIGPDMVLTANVADSAHTASDLP